MGSRAKSQSMEDTQTWGGASMGLAITTQTSTDLLGSDKISPSHFGYSGMCASLDKDFSEPYLFL